MQTRIRFAAASTARDQPVPFQLRQRNPEVDIRGRSAVDNVSNRYGIGLLKRRQRCRKGRNCHESVSAKAVSGRDASIVAKRLGRQSAGLRTDVSVFFTALIYRAFRENTSTH